MVITTPLAVVGLAITFARWAYTRSRPYDTWLTTSAIVVLFFATAAFSSAWSSTRAAYEDLERRHLELLEDNEGLVRDNHDLVADNEDLVADNHQLVRDNRTLVRINGELNARVAGD